MVAQVELLVDNMINVPTEAITLNPRHCGWKTIKERIAKKNHPWHELPGKAAGAFKRVKSRPDYFATTLNPLVEDPWTMPELVCSESLPSRV